MNNDTGSGRVGFLHAWRMARRQDRFEQLLQPHVETLYRLAFRLAGDADGAEELVQAVLVKAYLRREQLAQVEHLRAWLARILHNEFMDRWRRSRLEPVSVSSLATTDEQALADIESPEDTPEVRGERAQLQERIAQALMILSPEHREVVVLHDMEGYTMQELEAVLNVPLGTVKSRLHRARARLRELLADRQ